MSRLLIPNTTAVPNALFDHVFPNLRPGALRVLLQIVRLTYGWQKLADKISYTQLQKGTGLSREGVNKAVKQLGNLITIKAGMKGRGANEYSLNVNILTGELVRNSDQSEKLTSQNRAEKVVRNSDSSKAIRPKQSAASKKSSQRTPKQPDPRIKEFIDWFAAGYRERFGDPYHVKGGKDGQLIKNLLSTFDLPELQRRAGRLWNSDDKFISTTDRGIGILASQINKLSGGVFRTVANSRDSQEIPIP